MRRVNRRILRATGWDHQIHTAFQQRRRNHEYDEEHKSEIEQRRDIDLAQRRETLALRITAHHEFWIESWALDVGRSALRNVFGKRPTLNSDKSRASAQ